jgi:TPR repeat protein
MSNDEPRPDGHRNPMTDTETTGGGGLHPDAVEVARISAAAVGLSVEDWLSRTIMENAGGAAPAERRNGAGLRADDPLAVLERQLKIAEKAAAAEDISIDKWLSRAIHSAIEDQSARAPKADGRQPPDESPSVTPAPATTPAPAPTPTPAATAVPAPATTPDPAPTPDPATTPDPAPTSEAAAPPADVPPAGEPVILDTPLEADEAVEPDQAEEPGEAEEPDQAEEPEEAGEPEAAGSAAEFEGEAPLEPGIGQKDQDETVFELDSVAAFDSALDTVAAALDAPKAAETEPATEEPEEPGEPESAEDQLARIVQAARLEMDSRPEPPIQDFLSSPEPGPAIVLHSDEGRGRGRRRLSGWLAAILLAVLAAIAATIWVVPQLGDFGIPAQPDEEATGSLKLPLNKAPEQQAPAAGQAAEDAEALPVPEATGRDSAAQPAAPTAEPDVPPAGAEPPSPTAQVNRYESAARFGNVEAQAALARLYFFGDGVEQDDAKAAHWFGLAANAGNVGAQYAMAVLLENGQGVAKDPVKAIQWYEKAAAAGHLESLNNTGVAYYLGEVVTRDYAKAFAAFRTAAEAGLPEAQINLAQMYEFGSGVEINGVFAYKWYALALAAGEDRAVKALESLTARLSDVEIDRAKKLVVRFRPD